MKKIAAILLTIALLTGLVLPITASADGGERFQLYYTFDQEFYEAGDTVTVQLHLDRTDSDEDYTMYYFSGGAVFSSLYLEYIDSSAHAAQGVRVTPEATYYASPYYSVGVNYHGLQSPLKRAAKLVLAELQFKALKNIRSETLYHLDSSVSASANAASALTVTDGVYTIGSPTAAAYGVTFSAGADSVSGSAPAAVGEKGAGDVFLLPACSWTRTGYTFSGWSDGTKTYEAGESYTMPASEVKFTAQWTRDKVQRTASFTVGQLDQGLTVTGAPPALRKLYPGQALALPTQNTLELEGYGFEGWSVGNTVYASGSTYTMPDGNVSFVAVWKSLSTGEIVGGGGLVGKPDDPDPDLSWTSPFSDVKTGDWYYDCVRLAYQNKLMDGVGGGLFEPERPMTRAMMVTVLYRMAGTPAVTARGRFKDVPEGEWYSDAVAWASEQKIVEGLVASTAEAPGVFAPMDVLTRQQAVTILWRWSKSPAHGDSNQISKPFKDWNLVESWAGDAMAWAVESGLIEGVSADSVAPEGIANRAQCAALLTRLLP